MYDDEVNLAKKGKFLIYAGKKTTIEHSDLFKSHLYQILNVKHLYFTSFKIECKQDRLIANE